MNKAVDVKKIADEFNQPNAKQKRIKDAANHIVDILIDDSLIAAKRGQYDLLYQMGEMEKERIRLSALTEEEVSEEVVKKIKELGFEASFNNPLISISWR